MTSMNVSSSAGERCSRSGCQAMIAAYCSGFDAVEQTLIAGALFAGAVRRQVVVDEYFGDGQAEPFGEGTAVLLLPFDAEACACPVTADSAVDRGAWHAVRLVRPTRLVPLATSDQGRTNRE
jgi:hypothetical protein